MAEHGGMKSCSHACIKAINANDLFEKMIQMEAKSSHIFRIEIRPKSSRFWPDFALVFRVGIFSKKPGFFEKIYEEKQSKIHENTLEKC